MDFRGKGILTRGPNPIRYDCQEANVVSDLNATRMLSIISGTAVSHLTTIGSS